MPQVLNLRKKIKETEVAQPQPKNTGAKEIPVVTKKVPDVRTESKPVLAKIAWEAPSFYFNPQKRYLALVIIALALSGGGMLFLKRDMLTAIFLLLSSLVLVLYSNKRPEISKITIDYRGVVVGDNIYEYKDLRSFWIHYDPGNIKELSFESRRWYLPYVKVSIENNSPIAIRSLLINFLPEREHEHSLVDIIARKIGL